MPPAGFLPLPVPNSSWFDQSYYSDALAVELVQTLDS